MPAVIGKNREIARECCCGDDDINIIDRIAGATQVPTNLGKPFSDPTIQTDSCEVFGIPPESIQHLLRIRRNKRAFIHFAQR